MKKIRKSCEAEMILEFLKAELISKRFNEELNNILQELNYKDEIITNGDINNLDENLKRINIMNKYRGYPDKDLFNNFPNITEWEYVKFEKGDIDNIYYIDYDYWNELSNNTSLPIKASKSVHEKRIIFDVSYDAYVRGLNELKEIGKFPPVILITCNDEKYLIIEGHSRMTIYGLEPNYFVGTNGFVGHCSVDDMKVYDKRMI